MGSSKRGGVRDATDGIIAHQGAISGRRYGATAASGPIIWGDVASCGSSVGCSKPPRFFTTAQNDIRTTASIVKVMTAQHPYDIPTHPKLCLVEPEWVSYQGRQFLHIRGPISLTDQSLLVPENMAPLLPLCDGTRDVSALRGALALRTGVHLTESTIREFVEKMDVALLLENGAYQRAAARALEEYREAPHRAPSHAGLVYPPDAEGLSACLEDYCSQVTNEDESQAPAGALVGMVCPHIDYSRGHETYARLWRRAAPWLDDLELVVVFGTDHSGGLGALTLTRQDYLTPLGVLPTDREIVDGLAEALGPDRAFAEELHHVGEHSIELASVWLHYFLGGRSCPIVPILTGSFHHFVTGEADPDGDESIEAALAFLR